jgi:hypothetical protein
MNHIDKKTSVWLGIAMLLGGGLGVTSFTSGQDGTPRPRQGTQVAPTVVATPQMTIRGPNEAVVGRRFTLEVIIANPSAQAMKGLEFVAELDGNLEQDSKARSHLTSFDVAAANLHIVRLFVTPTKKGPARVDIILRSKDGQMQQVQHVMPVFAADDAPPQPERPAGSSPLQATITTPKNCFADQAGTFLIHFLNTDTQPTRDGMQVVVSYGTLNNSASALLGGDVDRLQDGGGPRDMVFLGGKGGFVGANPSNPVRDVKISLPSLAPNESRTVPVTLTPRRTGDFRVAIATSDKKMIGSAGVQARFDPSAPLHSLLPATFGSLTPRLPKTLADVPEVGLEDRVSKSMKADEAFEHVAHMLEKVKFANAKQTDAFAAALLEKRPDMNGMPMAMGDGCRLKPERASQFLGELTMLRNAMAHAPGGSGLGAHLQPGAAPAVSQSARIAAMMQVLGPESRQLREEMVKLFSAIASAEATQALASLAVFSEVEQVRRAATDALQTRREQDYSAVLVHGLNYPWPAVAQHAGEAIVKLKRTDLIPQLVESLERPDPRAPQTQGGKQVVREMVKINHLRNCMLCHPPASAEQMAISAEGGGRHRLGFNGSLVAQVPIPNQPLPVSPGNGGGYGQFTQPETVIRFDVTYLRQDFSVMLPVADHNPWPQTQRFDFLVRTREISERDAQTYRDLLRPAGAGDLSPYQRAAVSALRQLTGRDTEPTAPAWRRLLDQIKAEGGNG